MADTIRSEYIIETAHDLGFADCGIAAAGCLREDSERVEQWLAEGNSGEMTYLERNKEKRYDPRKLVEGTRSIVTLTINYYPQRLLPADDNFKIAKYTYGEDYHDVVKRKLRLLLERIEEKTGKLAGARVFVDSAPVLDKAWAVKCGLGFIGKNTTLIHPKKGSFFFVAHLFLPIELSPIGTEIANRCGRCTQCLDACPTGALKAPFTIDARKCISYLTIEYKGSFEHHDKEAFKGWMYGCDICQDVCPYNRFSVGNIEPAFQPSEKLLSMHKSDWKNMDETLFDELFAKSAVQRAGYKGLKRNIDFLSEP